MNTLHQAILKPIKAPFHKTLFYTALTLALSFFFLIDSSSKKVECFKERTIKGLEKPRGSFNHRSTAADFTHYWCDIKPHITKSKSIDYVLLFKSPASFLYSLKTERIPMYNQKIREESLSDHNTPLSSITKDKSLDKKDQCSPQVTTFLLVRHGKTDWNVQNRIQGYSDIPLNEIGKEQAQKVAKLLKDHYGKIDALYSSDLKRAVGTAEPIARNLGLKIITDPLLREQYMGDAEGMPESQFEALYGSAFRDLEKKYPDQWERWHHTPIPHGETKASVFNRVEKFLKDLAKKYPCKTVAIVTHGAVIKTLIAYYTHIIEHTPNCCVAEMQYGDKGLAFITIKK